MQDPLLGWVGGDSEVLLITRPPRPTERRGWRGGRDQQAWVCSGGRVISRSSESPPTHPKRGSCIYRGARGSSGISEKYVASMDATWPWRVTNARTAPGPSINAGPPLGVGGRGL